MFVFKRNQIIITALVFMVSIAAYLNFTDNKNAVQPTFEDEAEKIVEGADGINVIGENDDLFTSYEFADIDTLAPDGEDELDGAQDELTADAQTPKDPQVSEADVLAQTGENKTPGNIVEEWAPMSLKEKMMAENKKVLDKVANNTVVDDEEVVLVNKSHDVNYFVEAKMDREQKRSEQVEMLAQCISNDTLDKDSKSDAATNLITLQERIEKESAIESLLKAKGFKEVFVRISDDDVDVVINREKIEEADIAQIEDIVRRKTGYATSQIKISPLKN